MKTKQDFQFYFNETYSDTVQEYFEKLIIEGVNLKYEYPDDENAFGEDDYYFYYDVESDIELLDLVIEDDGPDTLLFHALYSITYDEMFIHPISICEMYHEYKDRGLTEFISVDLRGSVEDGFSHLEIVDNSTYNIHFEDINKYPNRYKEQITLDSFLLPKVYSENGLSRVAEIALQRFYPDYTDLKPEKIDPYILASSMGLEVIEAYGLKNNIEGIVFFAPGTFSVGESLNNLFEWILSDNSLQPQYYSEKNADAGTIVIEALNKYPSRKINTLMHECVHWFLHRKPYFLQVLLGEEAPQISCRANTRCGNRLGNYFERREWQASNLSPKMLLATHDVHTEIVESAKKKFNNKEGILPDCIEAAIREMSDATGLSPGGVAIQFKKGYRGLDGIFSFSEKRYLRPYWYKSDYLSNGETFNITNRDFNRLYATSPDFKLLIDSGLFAFVENHICLMRPDTIKLDAEKILLTDKVRMQMHKYCLVFKGDAYYYPHNDEALSGAFRTITKAENDEFLKYSRKSLPSQEYLTTAQRRKEDILRVKKELNGRLDHDLQILFEWSEYRKKEVYEGGNIDKNTFNKILNGTTKKIQVRTAIRLCIGLQLPRELAECLLNTAGIELDSSPLHVAYQLIIDHFTFEPIEKIDEFLLANGFPVLGIAD